MSADPLDERDAPLAVGTGFMLGYIGDVQVVYMDGRVTDASFARYLDAVARDVDLRDQAKRIGVVYYVPQPSAISAKRRRSLAEVLKAREDKLARTTAAYAMATPSAVVRSGLRMLFWLAPPPYPNAVVATPRAAFEYVARRLHDLDPAALAAEFERRIAAAEGSMSGP